ncbi:hypothetical protein OK015_19365 [Mycobacterium sp. Aquia_216]|uniref:hypothetical protein n=1 Tax=Mycobacterium sp. Aquia_216 TaxID=2991729 RepID=UPI00227B86E0|nr:hypothetical protein [Mycobacterium sp. Aquia_216]WAJ43358.1 hypothetical protein OK015_19365 [Mycobacterium sp. Aquia_216]
MTTDHEIGTDPVIRHRPGTGPALNRTARLACAWSGIACTVLFAIGFVAFARFLPFPSPGLSAEQVVANLAANKIGIRIGVIFMIIGFGLFATFVTGVALELRPTDGRYPALTYVQLVCGGASAAILALSPMFFGIMVYRVGEIPAFVTQALYDIAWFCFVMPYPVFSLLLLAQGGAILRDTATPAVFPRWAGFLCLATAAALIPTGFIIFFKDGPLAWSGIIGLGIPMIYFFSWIMTLSYYLIRHVSRETRR